MVEKAVSSGDLDRQSSLVGERVKIDMPQHMVTKLDIHARNRGVTRQALIKVWLGDRLESTAWSSRRK